MKAILTILFSLTLLCTAQEKHACNYLLVRIDGAYDQTMKRHYVAIGAEPGCEEAKLFYSLKVYDNKKNAVNGVYPFYYNHADTADTYYNYFLSTTEALNFISNNGWTLFAIYTDTYSGHTTESNGHGGDLIPITTISSRPWFCFKK